MAECELLEKCLFFNDKMKDMPLMADILKERYCKGDNSLCARYRVFKALGRDKVPADLFPLQIEKAQELIDKK